MVMAISTVIVSVVVALVSSWKLALIAMSSIVAIVLLVGVIGRFVAMNMAKSNAAHARAADVSEEALSSITIVEALGAYQQLASRFESHVNEGVRVGFLARVLLGFLSEAFCLFLC